MTGLSVSLTNVSAVARGIAEAVSIGVAANAQAATPISNKRFISQSPWRRVIAATKQCSGNRSVPLSNQTIAIPRSDCTAIMARKNETNAYLTNEMIARESVSARLT